MYIYDRSDVRFAYEIYFKKFKDEQPEINIIAHSETSQAYANVDIFEFENSYLVVRDSGDDDCLLLDDLDEVLFDLKQYFENFKESFYDVEIRYKINNEEIYNKFSFKQRMKFSRIVSTDI